MTVSSDTPLKIRPWRGYDDPGLPVGMYVGQGAVTGDASGGDMIVFFQFKEEGNPVTGRQFNIEQINVFSSDSGTKAGHVSANNWQILGSVGVFNRQWRFELEENANGVAVMTEQLYFPLPLFLGAAGFSADLEVNLEVGINNIDLSSLVVTIEGYIWEARSMQSEGGLRRPVDSLYGGGGR